MNYRVICYILGIVLNFEAVCLLVPFICAFIYGENTLLIYSMCILLCLAAGLPLSFRKPQNKSMYAKEGLVIVGFAWILMSIFGSLPFFFSGHIPNFIDALFETVSGFTTTGASILSDVEALPKSLLLWRSFTHWIGGMGVLVFLVAILPMSGGNNLNLMKAESTGPSVGKLVPKVKATAKWLYGMYIGFTLLLIILLLCGNVSLFETLTLAFGTAGTGGFAVLNTSVATYSPYVQVVITIFMIIFGIDFSVYFLLFLGKFKMGFKSDEARAYLGIVAVSIILITINCRHLFADFWEALRHSAFQVSSIITTTGFATTDFDLWPEFSKTILLILMFIGACAGSTGGGIKVSRVLILIKSVFKQIKLAIHPKSTFKITLSGRTIEHDTIRSVNTFMVSYIIIFMTSLLLISIDNMDFTTNFSAIAATINNIGPGLAGVGPTQNFGAYSSFSKLVMIFDMLVGRLEVFPIMVLLSPYTWRK